MDGKKQQYILFALFLLALFGKNVIFHACIFDGAMPWGAWQYITAKLCIAVLLASFVFISRKPWWTLGVLVLVDIWGLANWIYFRANGLFVSFSMLGFVTNLRGFSSSVTHYIDVQTILFLLPTIVYGGFLVLFRRPMPRRWIAFAVSFVAGLLLVMADNTLIHVVNKEKGHDYGPLTIEKMMPMYVSEHRMLFDWEAQYSLLRDHSIIGYFPLHFAYEHTLQHYKDHAANSFTERDSLLLNRCMSPDTIQPIPNSSLLFILVESLESWPLYYEGITPVINRLRESPHALYADKVKSQARHGISGDGQMTVNTGLLPLQLGVACILYATNEYPNFAHLYPRSAAVNPTKGTWNTNVTMPAYGYRQLIEQQNYGEESWDDAEICENACRWLMESDSLSCAFVMTFSSHSPFTRIGGSLPAITPDTPDEMRRYLTCIHYADSCIGILIDSLEAKGRLENTTIVITGDHAIFHEPERQQFLPYAQEHGLPISPSDLYIPLVICSPHIPSPVRIDEQCYQMDIYPAVMHAIGCEQYAWKGLGVNLFDVSQRNGRMISEEEAYCLSDKLIRNNWFKDNLYIAP